MAINNNQQKILTLVEGKAADIQTIDNNLLMEKAAVAMAIAKLRETLDKLEGHLNDREFQKASHVGYDELAHHFVYVQRTLAGLQTAAYQKEGLISNIAQEASAAYEEVAPHVDQKMQMAEKR
ncbi:MAG: hypothetical protein HOO92_17315 [Methylococcaceae bacterium]|nr:hypothetical protein [Methylococcaceae bacterium]